MVSTTRVCLRLCSIVLAVVTAGMAGIAHAQDAARELERAGVLPVVLESKDAICDDLFKYSVDLFVNGKRPLLEWSFEEQRPALPGFEEVSQLGLESVITQGTTLYVERVVHPGCGGGCETEQLYVSKTPFPPREQRSSFLAGKPATPPVAQVRLLRRGDDRYYVVLFQRGFLGLVELTPQGEWDNTCSIRLTPPAVTAASDPALRAATASLKALTMSVHGLMEGSGACGTLAAQPRRARAVGEALAQLTFTPRRPGSRGFHEDDHQSADIAHLDMWARLGVAERDAYRAYQIQYNTAVTDLVGLYQQRFGLQPEDARARADFGLRTAVGVAMSFPDNYGPFDELEKRLRGAILDRQPIQEIRVTEISAPQIDGVGAAEDRHGESLLNAAIEYPEALAHLLQLGANPNKGNDFGKTPLMYAAQHNAIDAARILLNAGANPNATTTWPEDRCYYTLETATMTPLHYAVRYASAELVDLLLDHGAATYIRTTKYEGQRADAPLDWFRRYTAGTWAEPNHNIAAEDVERLANRLAVPSAEDRAALAGQLTLDAEASYAAGDAMAAYALLRRALLADDSNRRALSDMSLIALRAGQPGEAAGAARKLIDAKAEARLAAQAWFNLGLACEAPDARFRVLYEGSQACVHSKVYPFLQAWLTEATNARAEKIADLFATTASCVRARADGTTEGYLLDNGVVDGPPHRGWFSRIYVYHPAAERFEADAIDWKPASYLPNDRLVPSGRHEIGDMAITIFEAKAEGITTVDGMPCVRQR